MATNLSTDILIIGAGASGLAAARDLSRTGFHVTVVEARSRIGGRIYTEHDPAEKLPIELGAEFIHGKSPELFSLINEAQLKFEEVTGRHWYLENGRLAKSNEFWTAVEDLTQPMLDQVEDQSLKTYLDSLPKDQPSKHAKEILIRYVEGFHAAQSDRIGVLGLNAANEASNEIEGDRAFRLLKGYEAVTDWLRSEAEDHGARFLLDTVANELHWQSNKVQCRCTSSNKLIVDSTRALITIPVALLKVNHGPGAIKFIPSLPKEKIEAIDHVEVGSALRIVMRFSYRFWERLVLPGTNQSDLAQLGFIHSPTAPFPTWWTTLPEHESILVGWAGGPDAVRLQNEEENGIVEAALKSLARIFGLTIEEVRSYLVKSYYHNWHLDPFALGGYTYLPVNGLDAQLKLAKPVDDTLFFAGEATTVGHIGTVHGALQSGQRAAREIFTASQKRSGD